MYSVSFCPFHLKILLWNCTCKGGLEDIPKPFVGMKVYKKPVMMVFGMKEMKEYCFSELETLHWRFGHYEGDSENLSQGGQFPSCCLNYMTFKYKSDLSLLNWSGHCECCVLSSKLPFTKPNSLTDTKAKQIYFLWKCDKCIYHYNIHS